MNNARSLCAQSASVARGPEADRAAIRVATERRGSSASEVWLTASPASTPEGAKALESARAREFWAELLAPTLGFAAFVGGVWLLGVCA